MVRIFYIVFLFLFSLGSFSQKMIFPSWDGFAGSWQVGVTLGPDFYYGDLNITRAGISHNVSSAGGVLVIWQVNNILGVRSEFLAGGLAGTKIMNGADSIPNPYFKGVFSDLACSASFDFTNIFLHYRPFRKIHVYGFAGVGIIGWSSKSYSEGVLLDSGQNASILFPFGLGASYTFQNRINLGIEYSTRMVLSDKLDRVEGNINNFDFINYLSFWVTVNIQQLKYFLGK